MALIRAHNVPVLMSTVNWCEVLTRLQRDSPIINPKKLASMLPGVDVLPFSQAEADVAAELAKISSALSLGDRACLALASSRKAVAWTTDKQWARLNLGVKVEFLR